jgi:hypothetical protein
VGRQSAQRRHLDGAAIVTLSLLLLIVAAVLFGVALFVEDRRLPIAGQLCFVLAILAGTSIL